MNKTVVKEHIVSPIMGCGQTRVASPDYDEEDDDFDPRLEDYARRYGYMHPQGQPGFPPGPGGGPPPPHMMMPGGGPGPVPPHMMMPGDPAHGEGPPSAMNFTTAPPHLNFDPRSAGIPARYEPPNSAARFFSKNKVILDDEMLEEYIRLERMIQSLERGRILQRLQAKVDELRTLDDEVKELERRHDSLLQHVSNKNIPSPDDRGYREDVDWATQTYAVKKGDKLNKHLERMKDKHSSTEQDIQFAFDIVTREMDKRKKKLKVLTREVDDLNVQAAHLLDLYLRLDEHLANLFSSTSTGNERMRELEIQVAQSQDQQLRLELANAKWQEAQMLLEFACRQLAVAVQHWKDLPQVPSINVEVRYDIETDKPPNAHRVRKRIQGVESIYDPSRFPFHNSEDLTKFNQVPVQVFGDMLEPLGLKKEDQKTRSDTYIRATILLQWFDQVLNSSMQRDLTEVSVEVRRTAQALRRERLIMARKKVQQVHGRDFDMDSGMGDSDGEEDLMKSGFQHLFINNTPVQPGRNKYNPYEEDKYDLRGDLERLEARGLSAKVRSVQGLNSTLQQRRVRRGMKSGHTALVDAVTTLQKLH